MFGHPKEGSRGLWCWSELPADIMRHGHICSLSAAFYFWRSTLDFVISTLVTLFLTSSTLLLTYTVCPCTVEVEWFFLSVGDEFDSHGESLRQSSMSTIQGWTSEKRRSHSFTSGTSEPHMPHPIRTEFSCTLI